MSPFAGMCIPRVPDYPPGSPGKARVMRQRRTTPNTTCRPPLPGAIWSPLDWSLGSHPSAKKYQLARSGQPPACPLYMQLIRRLGATLLDSSSSAPDKQMLQRGISTSLDGFPVACGTGSVQAGNWFASILEAPRWAERRKVHRVFRIWCLPRMTCILAAAQFTSSRDGRGRVMMVLVQMYPKP